MMKKTIKYTMTAPVSHIGETASAGSYFNMINTSNGKIPVITGNSIRGQLRDSIALHMLTLLGTKVDKEVFHILFSGGNISGTMKDDVERSKLVREHFPSVSLLGGGLGTMIMQGKLLAGFAYPVCDETADMTGENITGHSWREFLDTIEFTRMDDSKNDMKSKFIENPDDEKKGKASTQMRFEVEYMAAGTEFVQTLIFLDGTTDLELGAFFAGLRQWFMVPRLGGMSAKGFGLFDATVDDDISVKNGEIQMSTEVSNLIENYENHIKSEQTEFMYLLKEAGKKDGKKTNSSAKGDSASS